MKSTDLVFVEIPNSVENKTAEALFFCSLLPTQCLEVSVAEMYLTCPVFRGINGTQIHLSSYDEMLFVCKWLRALQSNVFLPSSDTFRPDFSVWADEDILSEECFTIMKDACCTATGRSPRPSWALFRNFVNFMNKQFYYVSQYPLLSEGILGDTQGLSTFKHTFLTLLVETSRDFSLRSLAQINLLGVGDRPSGSGEVNQTFANLDQLPMENQIVIERFQNLLSWESSEHPVVLFKQDEVTDEVSGVAILSLNPHFLSKYISGELKDALEANFVKFDYNWEKLTNLEAVDLLRSIEGLGEYDQGGLQSIDVGYVITIDNMLKMLSIQLRLRSQLPVIIMGETGCGKSSLIRSMCGALGWPLHTLNIHGGINDGDVLEWTRPFIAQADQLCDPRKRIVLFYDEVNTTNCMGLFKEILCDRFMDGKRLPDNISLIAACNPYRLRTKKSLYKGEEMAGLIYEQYTGPGAGNVGTGIKDPLRDLVYRVHPLPESMVDHIYDFGALSSNTERLYIKSMLAKSMVEKLAELQEEPIQTDSSPRCEEFISVFSDLICIAQETVRDLSDGERSAVSLRDVARCVKVFVWFGEHFYDNQKRWEKWTMDEFYNVKLAAEKHIRKATFLSLAYTYYARLPRKERRTLVDALSSRWRNLQRQRQGEAKCKWLKLDTMEFMETLESTQQTFTLQLKLGEGIAPNEALCENLFMILISVLNQIPLFVIGKPGSSKSLAMGLIQSNLNGKASDSDFLRSLPAVEVFSYQCSPLSTSKGIQQTFEAARRYKQDATKTIAVVLLDEIGLAEQSLHLPLKVLHKMLDDAMSGESVVGISNWALDPAKMNRAVHLYRPAPTVEDLSMTAEGMVRNANLKGYLSALARAYNAVYNEQSHTDFWGLREFYSIVRAINAALLTVRAYSSRAALDSSVLLDAVLRNFGGRPEEIEKVVNIFFNELHLSLPTELWVAMSTKKLIHDNLQQMDARHLMVLTKNNAALGLLFDTGILNMDKTEIIFGSDFPLDQTDLQICLDVQRIKLCMAEGITVVLVYGERLYESLYDLLNQHYHESAGQLYVRLAFGTNSRLCPIHRKFRIIVIVEKNKAYTQLAPPLLNRFEKQLFEHRDILGEKNQRNLEYLHQFCTDFVALGFSGADGRTERKPGRADMRAAFCGFHEDMLSSLLTAVSTKFDDSADRYLAEIEILKECRSRLLWIATPEATWRLLSAKTRTGHSVFAKKYGVNIPDIYFNKQKHSSLPALMRCLIGDETSGGLQMIVMTYALFTTKVKTILSENTGISNITHLVLHELDRERDLRTRVNNFFSSYKESQSSEGAILLVQCDLLATSLKRVEHTKFICETARTKLAMGESEHSFTPPMDGYGEEKESVFSIDSKGVHVIILIHAPRSSDSMYCVSFDTRWNYCFVDAIEPPFNAGLPDVENLIGKSMQEVVAGLDFKKVCQKILRPALSSVVYNHRSDRTYDSVREQIGLLLDYLGQDAFVRTVFKEINEVLRSSENTLSLDSAAFEEKQLRLSGTFQGRLHQQILDTLSYVLAVVLCHMDRNSGLKMFSDPELKDPWLKLFHSSFCGMNIFTLATLNSTVPDNSVKTTPRQLQGEFEVVTDGFNGKEFSGRFPFSFYIRKLMEEIRGMADQGYEMFAQQVRFQLVNLEIEDMCTNEEMVFNYLHDVCCMTMEGIVGMQRDEQAQMVLTFLELFSKQENLREMFPSIDSIAAVQFLLWRAEQIMELYFLLLNSLPQSAKDNIWNTVSVGGHDFIEATTLFVDVVLHELDPHRQGFRSSAECEKWMSDVEQFREPTLQLFGHLGSVSVVFRERWEKIEFFYAFLRDIARPLALQPQKVQTFLQKLDGVQLSTKEALQVVIAALVILNRDSMGEDNFEFQCPITLERMFDPVKAADGNTYERKSIEDWLLTNDTSPLTNEPLANKFLVPNHALLDAINNALKADMANFTEYYVFDIILKMNEETSLDVALFDELIELLAGKALYEDLTTYQLASVLPKDAGRIGLLRNLMRLGRDDIQQKLAAELCASVLASKTLDTSFCVCYAAVKESVLNEFTVESINSRLLFAANEVHVRLTEHIPAQAHALMEETLDAIAKVRFLMTLFANQLCIYLEDDERSNPEWVIELNGYVDLFLSNNPQHEGRLKRSMRLFMLKQLVKKKGEAFARSALQQVPLSSSGWVKQWREGGFLSFLGTNKLPQYNPLISIVGFVEMKEIIGFYLDTGDLAAFDQRFAEFCQNKRPEVSKAALLAALFSEIHLLSVLWDPEDENMRASFERINNLKQRILSPTHPVTGFLLSDPERRIFRLFSGGNAGASPVHSLFNLNINSSTGAIFSAQLIAHVVALSFSLPFFCWVNALMLNPARFEDSFFVTMPEDMQHVAQAALQATGEGQHWYTCPNGHLFSIGNCGRAWVTLQCVDCGANIGGTDHNLLPGNRDLGRQQIDRRLDLEKKYCLRDASVEANDKFFSVREIQPTVIQALRLVLHSAMAVGMAAGGAEWEAAARRVLNPTYCNPPDLSQFIYEHWKCNWDSLRTLLNRSEDEMSMLLHLGLASSGGNSARDDMPPAQHPKQLPAFHGSVSMEYRDTWESHFQMLHFHRYLVADDGPGRLEQRLQAGRQRFNLFPQDPNDMDEENSAEIFKQDLLETQELSLIPLEKRQRNLPALWSFRQPFSFEHFCMQLNMLRMSQPEPQYTLLAKFLEQETDLRSLASLPAVFEWLQFLTKRFSWRLDREAARNMTVDDVFQQLDGAERHRWETCFAGFAGAWNLSWHKVGRFGCLQIPSEYVDMEMRRDKKLTFCLPHETDEGICSLALVRFLVDRHNAFAEIIDERKRQLKTFREVDARSLPLPCRHFAASHAIKYNLKGDFIPFLEERCVSVGADGASCYDFKKAEDRLLKMYFRAIPHLQLELAGFVFKDEQQSNSRMSLFRQKVPQQSLLVDTAHAIKRDISSPAQAARWLEVLEMAISFLLATGGKFTTTLDEGVATMNLLQYLKSFLLMSEEDLEQLCSGVIFQQVQLKHLEDVFNILSEMTEVDALQKVSRKYCEPLSDRMQEELAHGMKQMEARVLLPLLRTFILGSLQEDTFDKKANAKETLGWIEVGDNYLKDLQWFQTNWPETVKMENLVSAFRFLENLRQ